MFAFLSETSFLKTGLPLFLVISSCLLLTGCGGEHPEAQYVLNNHTKSLIKEARTGKFEIDGKKEDHMGVEDYLTELFGSPAKMVAWQRLPVNFGGIQGTVTESKGEGTFVVQFDDTVNAFSEPQPAYWMIEDGKNQKFTITSYDPVTKQIVVQGELDQSPKSGATFILQPGKRLKQGFHLYMKHCLHCHGTSGDGAGPTAKYLSPRPRDFRNGVFKFKSTFNPNKIRRDDLTRTIQQGIPGTYMPSFLLLKEDELQAIIEYVRWLAMRGELELKMSSDLASTHSKAAIERELKKVESEERESKKKESLERLLRKLKEDLPDEINELSSDLSESWSSVEQSDSFIILPEKPRPNYEENSPEYKKSLERGRKLYLSEKGKCIDCHGPTGHGDGRMTEEYQDVPNSSPQRKGESPGFYNIWGQPVKPRDLTQGIYRGGRRPLDIYRRIRGGIPGTPMLVFTSKNLSDEEVWDIVNYVMSLQYEKSK